MATDSHPDVARPAAARTGRLRAVPGRRRRAVREHRARRRAALGCAGVAGRLGGVRRPPVLLAGVVGLAAQRPYRRERVRARPRRGACGRTGRSIPRSRSVFDRAMTAMSLGVGAAVAEAYDFGRYAHGRRCRRRPRRVAQRSAHTASRSARRPRRPAGRGRGRPRRAAARTRATMRVRRRRLLRRPSRPVATPTCSRRSSTTGRTRSRCRSCPTSAAVLPAGGVVVLVEQLLDEGPDRDSDCVLRPEHARRARRPRAHPGTSTQRCSSEPDWHSTEVCRPRATCSCSSAAPPEPRLTRRGARQRQLVAAEVVQALGDRARAGWTGT